jgi:hypothetical protein
MQKFIYIKQDRGKNLFNMKKYKFTETKKNYKDYSNGKVIYGVPKATNFPVRLASEIFQRCTEYLIKKGKSVPYTIYDPLCGTGYTLTVLGFLHGSSIRTIFASDSDKAALEFANKNLSLLNTEGIDNRIHELEKFIQDYNKISHKEALESAQRLKSKIQSLSIKTEIFQFNILTDTDLPKQVSEIDLVMADVPYGKLAQWHSMKEESNPIKICLDKIKIRLSSIAIVANHP